MQDSKYLFGLAALLIVGAMTAFSFNSVTSNLGSAAPGQNVQFCIVQGTIACNDQGLEVCELGNCMKNVAAECTGRIVTAPVDCSGGGNCETCGPFPGFRICTIPGTTLSTCISQCVPNSECPGAGTETRDCPPPEYWDQCLGKCVQGGDQEFCGGAVEKECLQEQDPASSSNCPNLGSDCNPGDILDARCKCVCKPVIDEVVWIGTVTDSDGVSDEIIVSASGQLVSSNGVGSEFGECMGLNMPLLLKPVSCTVVEDVVQSCVPFGSTIGGPRCGGGGQTCNGSLSCPSGSLLTCDEGVKTSVTNAGCKTSSECKQLGGVAWGFDFPEFCDTFSCLVAGEDNCFVPDASSSSFICAPDTFCQGGGGQCDRTFNPCPTGTQCTALDEAGCCTACD